MEDLHFSRITARQESPKRVKRHKSGRLKRDDKHWPDNNFWFTDFTEKYLKP